MAAGSVRFRSVYYNTTGDPIEWQIDVLDTEPVAQIIKFESTEPVISFEGLTQDLKPGIYPSTLKFGFYVRDVPFLKSGAVYGPSASIITDLLTSNEGRFRVKVYKDGALYYCGIILPDQCQYEDDASPYLLSITAADGLYRWKDFSYKQVFGQLEFKTLTFREAVTPPGSPLTTFVSTGNENGETQTLPGTEWVAIRHDSRIIAYPGTTVRKSTTTWARLYQYSAESPGTGWVDQGAGIWAKEPQYSNEQVLVNTATLYLLTRDLDEAFYRVVTDVINTAMSQLELADEYPAPDIMYDTASNWYAQNMANFTDDPFTMIRLGEIAMRDKDLNGIMEEICKLFFLRCYYSNGRYHFEQISYRDELTFRRWPYQADGTAGAVETASLDLNYDTQGFRVGAGGSFRFLAPLRSAEVSVDLDGADLMRGEVWRNGQMGERYLGRVTRLAGDQLLKADIKYYIRTEFDRETMEALPDIQTQRESGKHYYFINYMVRLVDAQVGTTYYYTRNDAAPYDDSWETTSNFEEIFFNIGFGTPFDEDNLAIAGEVNRGIYVYDEDVPGTEGQIFDVYVSFEYYVEFETAIGQQYWQAENPDKVFHDIRITGKMIFVDQDKEPVNASVKKSYVVNNTTQNSLKVENNVLWADTAPIRNSVDIYDGSIWRNATEWSVGGVGTGEPLLALCAREIMSLRLTPKRLYSGQFLTNVPAAENRILRGTAYYLPLRIDQNTDVDAFAGEFIEIAKTTSPDPSLIDVLDESNEDVISIGDTGDGSNVDIDPPLVLETNEEIAAASTLTECDIVNTAGYTIGAGSSVVILNANTGDSEPVVLSQQINPADTIMYFFSHTFLHSYPDASPIIIDATQPPGPNDLNKFHVNLLNFTGTEFEIPQLNWLYFKNMPLNTFARKVRLKRNGNAMHMLPTGFEPDTSAAWYRIDIDAEKFVFNGTSCLEFVDEWLQIDIDLKR